MSRKKYLALFLCTLFLLNTVFGGLLAESPEPEMDFILESPSSESWEMTYAESTPPAAELTPDQTAAQEIEVTPVPNAEQTEEPETDVTPEPDADPTAEPQPEVTPEPDADPTAEPQPEVSSEQEIEPTEAPQQEQITESSPAPLVDTQIQRKASKALPAFESKTVAQSIFRSVSSLNFSVTPDLDYINLDDAGGIANITWTIEAQGGTGTLLYAFDVYKNDLPYSHMESYTAQVTHSITTSDPGRYSVRAFVYEVDTNIELTQWSWETGVSALAITDVSISPAHPVVGDIVTWTVETTGGTGRLNYTFYLFKIVGTEYEYLKGAFESASNSLTYQVTVPAEYELVGTVNEPEITWFRTDFPANQVLVEGVPTLTVEGVFAGRKFALIREPITFSVSADCANPIEYDFHVYTGEFKLESSGWLDAASYVFTPQRSGTYRVEVFVRDSLNRDVIYSAQSDIVGVSNLRVNAVTGDTALVYPGDTITWTVDVSGWSGWLDISADIWLDGHWYDSVSAEEDGILSCIASAPGDYKAVITIEDQYKSLEEDGPYITVIQRPAPVNLSIAAISASSIKVSWSAVTGVSGYELSRRIGTTGTYAVVYSGTARSFTNTGRVSGSIYYYKVRAYKSAEGQKYFGLFSLAKVGVVLAKPSVTSAVSTGRTSVRVTWTAVKGASGYEMWRSTSPGGKYTRVYFGTSRTYKNAGLTTGRTYYYKVRAYKRVGSVSFYGLFSAYRTVKPR